MTPTIGRIVHYHLPGTDWPPSDAKLCTFAALVTGVSSRGEVSLCVFLDRETPKGRAKTSHASRVEYSETPKAYCWTWPPRLEVTP